MSSPISANAPFLHLFARTLRKCFISVSDLYLLNSIRIQHLINNDLDPDSFMTKLKEIFFQKIKILFSVTNFFTDFDWGILGSINNHQTFCKMVNALFPVNSQIYFPLLTPFWMSWIQIQIHIPITDPDPGEPFQNRSIWIQIRNTGFYWENLNST